MLADGPPKTSFTQQAYIRILLEFLLLEVFGLSLFDARDFFRKIGCFQHSAVIRSTIERVLKVWKVKYW